MAIAGKLIQTDEKPQTTSYEPITAGTLLNY